jgi:hypothetical protein
MYDDLPEYHWGPSFDAQHFTVEIDAHNDELFEVLRENICDRLHIPFHTSGCMFTTKYLPLPPPTPLSSRSQLTRVLIQGEAT